MIVSVTVPLSSHNPGDSTRTDLIHASWALAGGGAPRTQLSYKSHIRRAELRLSPITWGIILNRRGPSRMSHPTSFFVDQFACNCGDIYTGRTDRRPSRWTSERIPKGWPSQGHKTLNNCPDLDPGSSIKKHVITAKRRVDPISYFKPLLHNTHREILTFGEAMPVRLRNPAKV